MRRRGTWSDAAAFAVLALLGSGSAHADRLPVAVLWVGEPATVSEGAQVAGALMAALERSPGARPIDNLDDRRTMVLGGSATRAAHLQAEAERLFVQLKYADAASKYEAAERLLLEDVPFSVMLRSLAEVERNLLFCYDQLGRTDDAARAAERLAWTPGTHDDAAALLAKHRPSRAWEPASQPVRIVSDPPGVAVYRDLSPAGAAPIEVAGGDEKIDVVDLDLPGYRRVHLALGRGGGEARLTLTKEERLAALVDEARAVQPDAPPGLVAQIGARAGAARVLVLSPDGPQRVLARWLDVRKQRWGADAKQEDALPGAAMERLVAYVVPEAIAPPPAAAAAQVAAAPAEPKKSKWGAWGKWYTWVIAGGVVALVGGLLIAQQVGSDSLSVHAVH